MDCIKCENNYLHKIYVKINNRINSSERLERFDNLCNQSGDPRNPLMIIKSMYSNDCDSCNQYKKYYEKFL